MAANETRANPNKDLEIPTWINAEFFGDILRKDEPDHVKVLKFTPIAAIPPGENFTSVMVRVCMTLQMKDGSQKPKSYILKTTLDIEHGGKVVQEMNSFVKEQEMYLKFIPEFEALYKAAGRKVQIAPKCLFTENSGDRVSIVFEDLEEKKFINVDRLNGFDMAHMRRILQKLAEMHAASAVWHERNGPFPKEFQYGFLSGDSSREFHESIFKLKMKSFQDAMITWGMEEAKTYIKKLPTFDQFFNCGLRTMETDTNDFNVLNHGDFWSSNVMLNYMSGGDINEVLIVDYQICKWGSPAQDLLFFITISAAQDIRIKEYDHFVEIYYEHLIDFLKVLNFKKPLPKLRDIQMAMYKENNIFYAFLAVYNHLNFVLLPTDKDSNIQTVLRDDEIGYKFRMRALNNPRHVKAALELFPFYHHRGIFDFEAFN